MLKQTSQPINQPNHANHGQTAHTGQKLCVFVQPSLDGIQDSLASFWNGLSFSQAVDCAQHQVVGQAGSTDFVVAAAQRICQHGLPFCTVQQPVQCVQRLPNTLSSL